MDTKQIEQFIKKYRPTKSWDTDPHNLQFKSDLLKILKEGMKTSWKQAAIELPEDGELFEDGVDADFEDYWQEIENSLTQK